MIIHSSTDLFLNADTKSVSLHSENNKAISFQDCMNEKVAEVKNLHSMDDTFKNSTEKNDYKKDSYKDSSSRVKNSQSNDKQDVNKLTKDDLEKMSDEMKEKIMDSLSLSEEELEEVMSALNLSWMDLLNPDKLQVLLLACEGKGQVDLLTDENLNQCLKDILGDLKELLESYGVDFGQLESSIESLESDGFEEVLAETKDVAMVDANMKEDSTQNANDKVVSESIKENQVEQKGTSSDESKSFDSKNQTEESGVSHYTGNEQSLVTTVVQQDYQQIVTTVRGADSQGIISQVVTQVKVMVSEDTNSLQMQLYPEHLGKLSIEISEKSGVMTAQLFVESEDAKQTLISSMNELKDAFQEQNLVVSEIEVSVAPKSFEQQEQSSKEQAADSKKSGKSGTRNLRLDDLLDDEMEVQMHDEKIAVEMMQLNGSSVDFSA